MTNDSTAPADTRMMTVVHQALRRDLDRVATALDGSPPPAGPQRRAIAEHVRWMMDFLRAHHESEDAGLYPVVRARRPDAAPILDEMDREHRLIGPRIDEVEAAASAYGRTDEPVSRTELLGAVDRLLAVLLPHLAREEEDVMPIVSDALSDAEWLAIEHEHNLEGKRVAQLGREGHWLIDGADPDDRALVLDLVPAVPRFVLLHGYGRSYRRRSDACWRPSGRGRGVQKTGRNAVDVAAEPAAVWDVVADVTRVGEWSHECVECSFLGGATRAEPGARFRGRNRQGIVRWGRVCEVLAAEPPELVWRTVPTTLYPDSTVWRIRVTPNDAGTRLEQSFEVVRGSALEALYVAVIPAHRDHDVALTEDLRRLGDLAASPRRDGSVAGPSASGGTSA